VLLELALDDPELKDDAPREGIHQDQKVAGARLENAVMGLRAGRVTICGVVFPA